MGAPSAGVRRPVALLVVAIVLLCGAILLRTATLTPAQISLSSATTLTVRIPGAAPAPVWPVAGEAALDVEGVAGLGASGGQTPLPTASLAKVMTAYVTLKRFPLTADGDGFGLTITPADAQATVADEAQNQSIVDVRAGEQLNERQLLEGLLIPSGDNIARILAAHEAGSVPAFVAEMNATARSLGMTHTTYTDPSGFSASTVSTASDQLRVFEAAMQFRVFRQVVSMARAYLPVAGTVSNYDPLIADGYDGKTGSDTAAEGCLAFFHTITVGGRPVDVVGVVMHQGVGANTFATLDAAGAAAQRLVSSVVPALGVHTVVRRGARILTAQSADGATDPVRSGAVLSVIGWGGLTERLSVTRQPLGTALQAGQTVGQVALAGDLLPAAGPVSTRLISARTLSAPGLSWRLGHLL